MRRWGGGQAEVQGPRSLRESGVGSPSSHVTNQFLEEKKQPESCSQLSRTLNPYLRFGRHLV